MRNHFRDMGGKGMHRKLVVLVLLVIGLFLVGCGKQYEVSIDIIPEGAGMVSGGGAFKPGEVVVLSVEVPEGYEFLRWLEDGKEISTEETYQFAIDRNRSLVAEFAYKKYEVYIHTEGKGRVFGGGIYRHGEDVVLEAEAEAGYRFLRWEEAGIEISRDDRYVLSVGSDRFLVAIFVKDSGEIVRESDVDWSLEEIRTLTEEAMELYFNRPIWPLEYYGGQARKDLFAGNYVLYYPGLNDFFEDLEVIFDRITLGEKEVKVDVSLRYPYVRDEQFSELSKEIGERILSYEGEVVLERIFADVLKEQELSKTTTTKSLIIERDEVGLFVSYLDKPEQLFASFDRLFREAIVENIDSVYIYLNEDDEFGPFSPDSYIGATFMGKEIRMENSSPHYLADRTEIIQANGKRIEVGAFWSQLEELRVFDPWSGFGPQDYLYEIRVGEELAGKRQITLTRQYFVTTFFSTIGYVNSDGTVKLFDNISGRTTNAYHWSEDNRYLAYSWFQSGSGFSQLHGYDVRTDEVISINLIPQFEELFGKEFVGEFMDLKWSQDVLYFLVRDGEYWNEEGEISSWKFDMATRTLERED